MARTINAGFVKRVDMFILDADSVEVNYNENGRAFADEGIKHPEFAALVESLDRHGQMLPVEVRPIENGRVKLVFGYRRYRAIQYINKNRKPEDQMRIKCVLAQCNEEDAFIRNISENVMRKDSSPIDVAHCINKLRKSFSKTDAEISRIYGKDQAWVSRMGSLVNLSKELQRRVHGGFVPVDAALTLMKVPEEQRESVIEQATPLPKQKSMPEVKPDKPVKVKTAAVRKIVRKQTEQAIPRNLREVKEALESMTGPGEDKSVRETAVALLKYISGEIDEERLCAAIRVAMIRV